jgi:hypothetical protein
MISTIAKAARIKTEITIERICTNAKKQAMKFDML